MSRPKRVSTGYQYDSLSRLLSVLHQAGAGVIEGVSYLYDLAGNRTAKTNQLSEDTEQYAYDPLYHLTQVTQGALTTESYGYDQMGTGSSLGQSPYIYNLSNDLLTTPEAAFA